MSFLDDPGRPDRPGRDRARGFVLMVIAGALAILGVLAMSGVFGAGVC